MTRTEGRFGLMFRKLLILLLIVALASSAWFCWPRTANMRRFDPTAMGRLEADMWRCYYDKRYVALGWDLWLTARDQYGFSPLDSVQLAWHAARAARAGQPSQSRADAFAHALPDLKDYYQVITRATHVQAPVDELAKAELEWWVLRREHVGWVRYGEAIAHLTALTYAVPEPTVRPAALLRAEMMDYRDQRRDARMTAADWEHIARRLGESYALLKQAVR